MRGEDLLREYVGCLLQASHSLVKDRLPGGLADQMHPGDFDPRQLAKGIEHELEHTGDPDLAREIAMDHLAEDPLYYDHLEQLEAFDHQMPSDSAYRKRSVYVPREDKDEIETWLSDMGLAEGGFLNEMPLADIESVSDFADDEIDDKKRSRLQHFFSVASYRDKAIRLYRNLPIPIYIVPVATEHAFDPYDERLNISKKPKKQLEYLTKTAGITPDRAKELVSALKKGAAVFVVTQTDLRKDFLSTPWMIVHALLDNYDGLLGGLVDDVAEVIGGRQYNWGQRRKKWKSPTADDIVHWSQYLTMKSARRGKINTADDLAAEILTQAIVTKQGFRYREPEDPEMQEKLARIADIVSRARDIFVSKISGKVIEVGMN